MGCMLQEYQKLSCFGGSNLSSICKWASNKDFVNINKIKINRKDAKNVNYKKMLENENCFS